MLGSRCRRAENEQVERQRHRSTTCDEAVRHRRAPLHTRIDGLTGAPISNSRRKDRRLPQFREQDLERRPFAHMHLAGIQESRPPADRSFPGLWIRSRLNNTIQIVTMELEAYRFDRATHALYQFFWHELLRLVP